MNKGRKPHFEVAAGLIWKDGKVLIARRQKGIHLEGFWEFPGGKQEVGETLEQCLEREIEEELSLRVRAERAVLKVDHDYGNKLISLNVFQCAWCAGEPRGLQGQELQWVNPSDLKTFTFPPPDQEIIQMLTCCLEKEIKD